MKTKQQIDAKIRKFIVTKNRFGRTRVMQTYTSVKKGKREPDEGMKPKGGDRKPTPGGPILDSGPILDGGW